MKNKTKYYILVLILSSLSLGLSLLVYDDAEVKSVIIQKIINYIEWPEYSFEGENFVIGVVGNNKTASMITNILPNKMAKGRKIEVRNIDARNITKGLHILYLADINKSNAQKIFNNVSSLPVLIVSDNEEHLPIGVHVILYTSSGGVRFYINETSAKKSNLVVSSKLMQLSRTPDN